MKSKFWFGVAMVAVLLFATTGVVVAQEEEEEMEAISITGCLVEVDEGEYILEEDESGDEIELMGEGLGDHAGHSVTITGVWAEDEDGWEYFEVDVVEHLDTSCD